MKEDVLEQIVDDYLQFKGISRRTTSDSGQGRIIRSTRAIRIGCRPMSMSSESTRGEPMLTGSSS